MMLHSPLQRPGKVAWSLKSSADNAMRLVDRGGNRRSDHDENLLGKFLVFASHRRFASGAARGYGEKETDKTTTSRE